MAIPGFFPPIEIGAEPYVDGCVLMNTPLSPAIDLGADVIHLIYLDPDIRSIPLSDIRNTLGTIYRMMIIGWAATVNDDVEDARLINLALAAVNRLEEEGTLDEASAESIPRSLARVVRDRTRFRPLVIHRYHPRDDLAGGAVGLLNFDSQRLRRLIERGFHDAQLHDCKQAGCVLVEPFRTGAGDADRGADSAPLDRVGDRPAASTGGGLHA